MITDVRINARETHHEPSNHTNAQHRLQAQHIPVRLVSMPSWELFEAQSRAYREAVLPPSVRARLAVEAGVAHG